MIFYNNNYPKSIELKKTFFYEEIVMNKFLILYDFKNLIIYNLESQRLIFNQPVFTINPAWTANFDIAVNNDCVGINYKVNANNYSYNNYFKVFRFNDTGAQLIIDLHYTDNRNFNNTNNDFHELTAKVMPYKNGFTFPRFTAERWYVNDGRENWCGDYQAIKPLEGLRYDKIFCRMTSVDVNSKATRETLLDLSKIVGELIECQAGGSNRHRRMLHEKQIQNIFISNKLCNQEGIEQNHYFFTFLMSYKKSYGFYRKHRRRHRTCRHWSSTIPEGTYNTECSSVLKIEDNGAVGFINGFVAMASISNYNSIHGNSIFTSFRTNKYYRKNLVTYDGSREVSVTSFDDNGKLTKTHYSFFEKRIEKFNFNLQGFSGKPEDLKFGHGIFNDNYLIYYYDLKNINSINFCNGQAFKNKSYQVFQKELPYSFALTNDSIFEISNSNVVYFNGTKLLIQIENSLKYFELRDFEKDFKEIEKIGNPIGVEKDDKYLYCSFDFSEGKFPILWITNKSSIVTSDFVFNSNIKIFELKNIETYYHGNKNVYLFNQFQNKVIIYDLKEETSLFKNGNIYSFNIEFKLLNIASKQKSYNETFDLLPITKLEEINCNYCSNQIKFFSPLDNHNKYFYIYLFDAQKKLIQESGINFNNSSVSLPNEIARSTYYENELHLDFIGLLPNENYITLIIPFSSAFNKNLLLNKTYDEIKSSKLPFYEYAFKTNIVPKIQLEKNEKINNMFDVKLKDFNIDKYSKLKYTYLLKNKKWNTSKFEVECFKPTDEFSVDFLNRPLVEANNYLTIFDDLKIQLKGVYFDENLILLINHYDIFKNKFIFNKTNPNIPEENYHLEIPFTFEQLNSPSLNFVKKGLGYTFMNSEKINYANFPETSTSSTFNSITFNIPNYDFNKEVVDNFGEVVTIKYQLNEILAYKVHLMMLPQGDLFTIPDKYSPGFEHYKSFNVAVNRAESHSVYTKTLLEAGQEYSYYIEPIFFEDRINIEMNQMIWDKLKTPDRADKKHKQYKVTTKEFKYLKNNTFEIKDITDNSFVVKAPTQLDLNNANQGIDQNLINQLDLRMQIFEKSSQHNRVYVKFISKELFGKELKVNYFDNTKEYYVTFNSCLNNNDANFTLIKEDEKKYLTMYPSKYNSLDINFASLNKLSNKITFNFDFVDHSECTVKMYSLDTLNALKIEIKNFEVIKEKGILKISLSNSNLASLYDKIYLFEFYRTRNSLWSEELPLVVALPKLMNSSMIEVKERYVDWLLINIKNVISNTYNTYTSNNRIYLKRQSEGKNDFSYAFNSRDCLLESGKNLEGINIINLIPGQNYQIQLDTFFDNEQLINLNFPQYLKTNKYYPKDSYLLEGLLIQLDNGEITNITLNRFETEGKYNVECSFNYYGIEAQAKIGFTKDGINLDTTKPFVWQKLNSTSTKNNNFVVIENVGYEELNFFMEFYNADKTQKIKKIHHAEFPKLDKLKRISLSIDKIEQVLNKGNKITNAMVFYGTATPTEADFNITCTSIESNFNPNITFVSYQEQDSNKNPIKKFKFVLNDLEYGFTYSKNYPIQIYADSVNKNLYLDSFLTQVKEFKLRYPLLPAVKSLELPNTIKSEVSFLFQGIKEASYYEVEYYYRDLKSEVYDNFILYKEKIRNNFSSDRMLAELDSSIETKTGYYKARITTLNFDLEPADKQKKIDSTTEIEILYYKDKVCFPEIISLNNTSEKQSILNWSFEDECFKQTEDKKPDSLIYTNNFNLANEKDYNGWYVFDIKNYNIMTLPFVLNQGLNEFWFKTYNKETNRYSNLVKKEIIFDTKYDYLIPDQIESVKFFGVNKDGLDNNFEYSRLIKINDKFKINKIGYLIKDNTNNTVSTGMQIFEGSPFVKELYIKIDYDNALLKDGIYTIEFYNYDKLGQNPKKFKVSILKIKTLSINTPKIQLESVKIV